MAVTVGDVGTTTRRPVTPDDEVTVQRWIDDVLLELRLRFGDRFGELDPDAVDLVVREVVGARWLRPRDEATSTSVAVDDGTVTRRWEGSTGSGARSFADWMDWLAGLLPDDASARGAWSIRLAGGGRVR